jgi:hypothetical protein
VANHRAKSTTFADTKYLLGRRLYFSPDRPMAALQAALRPMISLTISGRLQLTGTFGGGSAADEL